MPRRSTRKLRNRRRGGASYSYVPASVDYEDVTGKLNLAQGRQFAEMHQAQHGGAALVSGPYPTALGDVLPQDLAASARLLPLQKAFDEIKGLSDQAGGRRRRRNMRKSMKGGKKSRKSKKSRKNRKSRRSRRSRRSYRGGNHLGYQAVDAPGMLLSNAEYKQAGLNPEWNLAADPNAFNPVAPRS
jgi:hypothetical protein